MKKSLAYLVGGVALLLVLSVCVLYARGQKTVQQPGPLSAYQQLEKKWEDAFDRSPDGAYGEFMKEANPLSYDEAHKLAHVIGGILYKKFGMQGIQKCTQDFAYGCYHGFAGAALSARGLSGTNDLRDACNGAGDSMIAFGCIHGIGHGILAYLGNEKLSQALEACASVNNGQTIGGCYGGVFMEYNYNTMQSADGIKLRPFDASAANEPCATEVPEKFRGACYYELPSWWKASLGEKDVSTKDQYRVVGGLCAVITDSALRDTCFRGIGNTIGPGSGYESATMRDWCSVMPTAPDRDACLHEALQHLLQSDAGKAQLRALCTSGQISYGNLCGAR
ncbi:hypothetical protein K8R03_02820 [Candidatus Kaiserbacteria bacterium]|nr:hypothetical protein [Candidatus Kaiserbacteria bacterium]